MVIHGNNSNSGNINDNGFHDISEIIVRFCNLVKVSKTRYENRPKNPKINKTY